MAILRKCKKSFQVHLCPMSNHLFCHHFMYCSHAAIYIQFPGGNHYTFDKEQWHSCSLLHSAFTLVSTLRSFAGISTGCLLFTSHTCSVKSSVTVSIHLPYANRLHVEGLLGMPNIFANHCLFFVTVPI